MNAYLKIQLRLGRYEEAFCAEVEISDATMERFKPVDFCDDPFSAFLSGEQMFGHRQVETVKMDRHALAKVISEQVTRKLINYMESRDKHQGYSREETEKIRNG